MKEIRDGDLMEEEKRRKRYPNLLPFLSPMWPNNGAYSVNSLRVIWSSNWDSACFYY